MATDTSRKGTPVNGSLRLVGKVIAKHAPFHENENNYNEATTSTITRNGVFIKQTNKF
jgi:hypothetical protein